MKVGGGSGIIEKKRSRRTIEVEREGVLNMQPLAVKSLSHSSSFLECAKGKADNEKM
jgi:hypothetical protein